MQIDFQKCREKIAGSLNEFCNRWCKRHFIKIPFIYKGMDFIDLPSIFRDKSVQSSLPNYFKNCEVPIICYKYNKPIRGAIFNFNKLVSDLDIETCLLFCHL